MPTNPAWQRNYLHGRLLRISRYRWYSSTCLVQWRHRPGGEMKPEKSNEDCKSSSAQRQGKSQKETETATAATPKTSKKQSLNLGGFF